MIYDLVIYDLDIEKKGEMRVFQAFVTPRF